MYRIKNVKENKYLNLVNDDHKDGIGIKVDEKGVAKSQFWAVIPSSDKQHAGKGAYHVRTVFGKSLELPLSKLENNAKMQQGSFTGSEGQTWIIKEI